MRNCGKSRNQSLVLLAALVSIQIAQQVTEEQLELLAAFFTVLGDSLALLSVTPPEESAQSGSGCS
ncbi:MAG: hypothetical protein PUC36_00280 [Clostridiales bacterium]|nr:hypothetical protein [Clostridiales bacterium]